MENTKRKNLDNLSLKKHKKNPELSEQLEPIFIVPPVGLDQDQANEEEVDSVNNKCDNDSLTMSLHSGLYKLKDIRWGGILALLGGFLIQLTLGSFYSFGNMMTYMTSYMRYGIIISFF